MRMSSGSMRRRASIVPQNSGGRKAGRMKARGSGRKVFYHVNSSSNESLCYYSGGRAGNAYGPERTGKRRDQPEAVHAFERLAYPGAHDSEVYQLAVSKRNCGGASLGRSPVGRRVIQEPRAEPSRSHG